jgi:hypothetical protein
MALASPTRFIRSPGARPLTRPLLAGLLALSAGCGAAVEECAETQTCAAMHPDEPSPDDIANSAVASLGVEIRGFDSGVTRGVPAHLPRMAAHGTVSPAERHGARSPACSSDTDCDDGLACNGQESCQDGLCRSGIAVLCKNADPERCIARCEDGDRGPVCVVESRAGDDGRSDFTAQECYR